MRQHPISPVTEPMQYRAIGVVRGLYEPTDPDQPTRGLIRSSHCLWLRPVQGEIEYLMALQPVAGRAPTIVRVQRLRQDEGHRRFG